MAANFIPNRFIKPQLLVDPELQAMMEVLGNQARESAERDAPVLTGRLKASIRVERTSDGGRRIIADVPYAIFVEYGTSDTPMQPFLRPALSKLGLHR